MIGNDIVDLELAQYQSNWLRPGYLQKIFTKKEIDHIQESLQPNIAVWKLWSRKEAAYKVFNRETGIRGYFPWKLECSINGTKDDFEKVYFDDLEYFTQTYINERFIYSIAASSLNMLNAIIEIVPSEKIMKIDGIPFLEANLKPISITHHGNFKRIITFCEAKLSNP